MMKKLFAMLAALCILLGCLAGCNGNGDGAATTAPSVNSNGSGTGTQQPQVDFEGIDYAGQVQLDMDSDTVKQEVTVKSYIDGDTTHFYVPESVVENGLLKARYLAVNTPESTGKIEVWGKKASNFTKERLQNAESIIIESDDGKWNLDSTGGRHLVWVWYKPAGGSSYRNLNIELLQNGLSVASKSAETRYGETCMAAITQAKELKLHVHSKDVDPDFYYGDSIPVTLKELRVNTEAYSNLKVCFEGVISREGAQTVYVEEYDEETGLYYGMTVYYGYNLSGTGLEILTPGNRVKVVGSVQYYATGGTWQISDIQYVEMRPNDPSNVQLISEGHSAANTLTDPAIFNEGEVTVEIADEETDVSVMQKFPYAQLALGTSISMKNLQVVSIKTTTNEDSSSKGAMTINCIADGHGITVRTIVLRDENGDLITASAYEGKLINVTGIVDYFSGDYQIKVFTTEDIEIVG